MQAGNLLDKNGDKLVDVAETTMSQKQTQNGNVVSDVRYVTTFTAGETIRWGFRQKVMDFFYYSVVQGSQGDTIQSCTDKCGKGIFS